MRKVLFFIVPLLMFSCGGNQQKLIEEKDQKIAELQEQLDKILLSGEELEETKLAREKFIDSVKRNDRALPRGRGNRISKTDAQSRIALYKTMRDELHQTRPTKGKELGMGIGFGLGSLGQLLKDIETENLYIRANTNPSDSLEITGVRAHFALKEGMSNGRYVDHLDVILTPCRLNGQAVFEWMSSLKLNTSPPPMDDSNPCPDTCP